VLLNGRRVVPSGAPGDTTGFTAVDLNTIPTQAIQRIEVLKDGASAIYGSDAIAGVVNIITRKDFTGTEVGAYAGTSQRADGTVLDANVTSGTTSDRGNILFSLGFTEQMPVWAGDRDFSRFDRVYDFNANQIGTLGSSAIPAGRFAVPVGPAPDRIPLTGNAFYEDLRAQYPPSRRLFVFGCPSPFNEFEAPQGNCDPSERVWRPFVGGPGINEAGGDFYNYQPQNYLVTPMRRINLFSLGSLSLGGGVNGFFEASYTNRQSNQKLAFEPLFTSLLPTPISVSAESVYNPFGLDFSDVRRRLVEFNNRIFSQDLDTFRVVTGIGGGWDLLSRRWTWDASLNYGRTQGVETTEGIIQLSKLEDAIGPSFIAEDGTPTCGTPEDPIPITVCVPMNLFGGPGSITDDMVRNVSYIGTARGYTQQFILSGNATGELVRVGTAKSPIAVALGFEHRREAGADIPDPLQAKGDITGNTRTPTTGAYYTNEGYLEVSLPLVGPLGEAPGDLLELSAAARLVNYNTFGGNTSYKFGARVRPIPDATLRGTFSTAFRAPAVGQLFLGVVDSFPTVSDPCAVKEAGTRTQGDAVDAACDEDELPDDLFDDRAQILAPFGGNPDLEPETAQVWTAGIVLQPRWVRNLSFTADYYNINLRNSIDTLDAETILGLCYPTSGGPRQLCDLIRRYPDGTIERIDDTFVNVGGDRVSGLDLAIDYEPTTPFGTFGVTAVATYLAQFERELAGPTYIQGRNTYDLELVLPDWKANLGVRWAMGGLSANANLRWFNGFKECDANNGVLCSMQPGEEGPAPVFRRVEPWAALDLGVGFRLPRASGLNTSVMLGVNNVTDARPVYIANGFTADSDPSAYDFMGRYFFVRLGHQFN
jgi:outer membrane receptor protein involved in Fe transport